MIADARQNPSASPITADQSFSVAARPKLQRSRLFREALETLVLIAIVYTLVNLATVRFYIEGPSMQPTFWEGQFLIVSRAHYLFGTPERGDIVVFDSPADSEPEPLLIKRLIGLPGETVELREGVTFINGQALEETYVKEPCNLNNPSRCTGLSWTLGANEYFFMGDNRNNSNDSRAFGVVSRDLIIGEVIVRYFPFNEFALINGYTYP